MNAKMILLTALLPAIALPAQDDAWPRHLGHQGHKVVVFEPELLPWLALPAPVKARAIVAVTPNGGAVTYYGEMRLRFATQVGLKPGQVLLTAREIESTSFPKATKAKSRYLADVLQVALPAAKPIEASAAQLSGAPVDRISIKREPVQMQVVFSGPVAYRYIGSGVSYAINTKHDLFRLNNRFYLCEAGVWYVAASPRGAYEVCAVVPTAIYRIPKGHAKYHVTFVVVHEVSNSVVVVGLRPGFLAVAYWAKFHYHGHHHPHFRHLASHPVARRAAVKRRVRTQPVPRRVVGRPRTQPVRSTPKRSKPARRAVSRRGGGRRR